MLWAGILHGSTSRSSTPLSTTIQLLRFFSQPLTNLCRGALFVHRPSHGITFPAPPQLLVPCNMLQLKLPPLPLTPNLPKPILSLYSFTKSNRPLRTRTLGQPLPKPTPCHTPQPRQIFILWSLHRLSLLPTSTTHPLMPPPSLTNNPTLTQHTGNTPTSYPPHQLIRSLLQQDQPTSCHPLGVHPGAHAPPRSTTPHRTRFSQGRSATQTDIRRGSPAPQPRATSSIPFLPQPSQPPPTQPPAYHAPPMTAAPPASHYTTPPPPVQLPHASPTPSASIPPVAHAWPAPYPTPAGTAGQRRPTTHLLPAQPPCSNTEAMSRSMRRTTTPQTTHGGHPIDQLQRSLAAAPHTDVHHSATIDDDQLPHAP